MPEQIPLVDSPTHKIRKQQDETGTGSSEGAMQSNW